MPTLEPAQRKINLEQLLEKTKKLPATPQLIPRLQRAINDPDVEIDDILKLIRIDTSLTSGVIRLANTAFFRGGSPVRSIDEAVSRLGYSELYRMVCLVVAEQVLNEPLQLYNLESGELLVSSICTALATEALCGLSPKLFLTPDEAYTIGLLHSVGKIVVNSHYLSSGIEFYNDEVEVDPTLERKILGFEQAELGGALLEKWGFPEEIFGPVLFQNCPLSADTHTGSASLLYLGLLVRPWLQNRVSIPAEPYMGGYDKIFTAAGLEPNDGSAAVENARESWEQNKSLIRAMTGRMY